MTKPDAYLVESIPLDLDDLRPPQGVAETKSALKRLVDAAAETIDVTAVYWSLLTDDDDMAGLSEDRLAELGAGYGRALFAALANAARRGVRIRILQSPGFGEGDDLQESGLLAAQFPDNVQVRPVDLKGWYGGGIMHHKSWIVDGRSFYLGSANMDWRSLTQVKELGVIVENQPPVAADAARQFETWWQLAAMEPQTTTVLDATVQVARPVPCWSALIPEDERCSSPLPPQPAHGLNNPLALTADGVMGTTVLTASPPELTNPGRTDDLAGLLHTIRTAERSVCLSVMAFTPTGKLDEQLFWWPQLTDALLQAVINRGVDVRFLLGWWHYTYPGAGPFLRALMDMVAALQLDTNGEGNGRLQIKRLLIPGWDSVEGEDRRYPGHSRVSHAKYIVTERRLNIGTSNMSWGYFYQTIGGSFNTGHPALIQQAQAIFDRDWESGYARPLN